MIKNNLVFKIWFRYLKEKKIFGIYFNNINEYIKNNTLITNNACQIHHNNDFIGHRFIYKEYDLLFRTFPWSKTLEGYDYWIEINDEWQGIISKKYNIL